MDDELRDSLFRSRAEPQRQSATADSRNSRSPGGHVFPFFPCLGEAVRVGSHHDCAHNPGLGLQALWRICGRLAIAFRVSDHAVRSHEVRSRSEEHTSELQSRRDLVCRLLLEKKKKKKLQLYFLKKKKKRKKQNKEL